MLTPKPKGGQYASQEAHSNIRSQADINIRIDQQPKANRSFAVYSDDRHSEASHSAPILEDRRSSPRRTEAASASHSEGSATCCADRSPLGCCHPDRHRSHDRRYPE
jgi:hypothetical protein